MSAFVCRCGLGPAGGVPVAVKDTIDVAGLPTRAGSAALEDAAPAAAHAEAVRLLLEAGARIVGKTTLHELAFGVTGINDHAGTAPNPLFPGLIPGGSSSGSASAVAGGEARVALGTDTGGSVRIPAACCGVWGLKPSYGLVSRRGVTPPVSSLDCVGPFARNLEDIEWAMAALAPGFTPERVETARIGWLPGLATPGMEAMARAALDRPGVRVTEITLPSWNAAFAAGIAIINAENWAGLGPLLRTGRVGEAVAARLRAAGAASPGAVAAAEAVRAAFTAEIDAALAAVDVIALPTLSAPIPTVEAGRADQTAVAATKNVRGFNLSGHPALAMPIGARGSQPVSLQLVGPRGRDALVCAVAALLV